MSIEVKIGLVGQVGIYPELVFISTTDDFATTLTPGYLTQLQNEGYNFSNNQMAFLNANDQNALVSLHVENGEVSLVYPFGEVNSVFGRSGVVVAQTGDYNTSQVTESGNLYFTQPRVRSTPLTGLSITNSAITATDSVLSAFGKTQGQINAIVGSEVISVFGRTGAVVAQNGDYNTSQVTENTNLYFTNARAIASTLTGFSPVNSVITSADSVLVGLEKAQGQISAFSAPVTSVFGRTGAVVAVNTDYYGVNYFQTTSQIMIGDTATIGTHFQITGFTDSSKALDFGVYTTSTPSFVYFDSMSGGSPAEIKLQAMDGMGGRVSIGLAIATAAQSLLDVDGDISLAAITTPATPRSNSVKLYPKTDHNLYFLNDLGVEERINAGPGGPVISVFGRTGAVVATSGDYTQNQITGLTTSDSPTFTNLVLSGGKIDSVASIQATSSGGNVALISSTGSISLNSNLNTNITSSGGGIDLMSLSNIVINANSGGAGINLHGTVTAFNEVFIDDSPLFISSSGNPLFKLQWDDTHTGMVMDSLNGVGGPSPLWINPTLGNSGFGFSAGTTLQSIISSSADIFLNDITTPSTPTGGGKFYSKLFGGKSVPFFLDSAGIDNNLTPGTANFNIVSVSSSTYTNTGLEDELVVNSNGVAVAITIDTSLLTKELRIYKSNAVIGALNITITPSAGQTINGSSSAITIYASYLRYSYVRIVPSGVSTVAYLADISISYATFAAGADWRPSGIQYQWGGATYGPSIPALTAVQVTLLWSSPFPTNIFNVSPSVVEATGGLPLAVKVISQNLSQAVIEVMNLSATTATTTNVIVSARAIGN